MNTSATQTNLCVNSTPQPRSFWARLADALAVSRQRRQLLDLEDHMLNDIGISRSEAMKESMKTAWNVPSHWRK